MYGKCEYNGYTFPDELSMYKAMENNSEDGSPYMNEESFGGKKIEYESTSAIYCPIDNNDWQQATNKRRISKNTFTKAVSVNPKLQPGKYYKKLHWLEHVYFQVDRLGKGTYVVSGTKVSSTVLSSNELVECDKNGKIKEKEFAMSRDDVNYFGVNYKFVGVTHNVNDVSLNSTEYIYKCDNKLDVQKEDIVCVENKNGFILGKVVNVYEDTIHNANLSKVATAWVVDRIDITAQAARRVATERRAYVLNKLKEKQEQVETIKMYEYLAAVDPEAKVLLEELKDFGVSLLAINK